MTDDKELARAHYHALYSQFQAYVDEHLEEHDQVKAVLGEAVGRFLEFYDDAGMPRRDAGAELMRFIYHLITPYDP